ncbi:MAG: hypothetical protein C0631_07920 [Sedimenticola sp.]|nr:MAG: hypothetical protein C0631_07920 [Sedimenticola sp.]
MKSQNGLSLVELTVVIMILVIVAVVAIPHLASTDPHRIELAAKQVAGAIRFARSESIRTGEVHGVAVDYNQSDAAGKEITVYKADLAQSPFAVDSIAYHPVDKQPYDRMITETYLTRGIGFLNTAHVFDIQGQGRKAHLHFTAQGVPVYFVAGKPYRLINGTIRIGDSTFEKVVTVAPLVGRVKVQ